MSAPVSMRIARFQLTPRGEINMTITISAANLDLCLRKTRADKSPDYREVIVLVKAPFSKCFPSKRKRKAPFSDSSVFKSVFEKLCTFSGLVWTEGLIGEIKLRFQIPPFSRAFSKSSVFGGHFLRISVDGRPNRRNKAPFSDSGRVEFVSQGTFVGWGYYIFLA